MIHLKQYFTMQNYLIIAVLTLFLFGNAQAVPVVYTDEDLFLADLSVLGYAAVQESFEDGAVWAGSRNSSVSSVTNRGIVWTSNYPQNNIASGTVGGSAPDGAYAIYSLPHGKTTDGPMACDDMEEPLVVCYQNDGLKVESSSGKTLYAFGGCAVVCGPFRSFCEFISILADDRRWFAC